MELHLQGLLREMSVRENENGNGQDWNAWPVRLGCMSNSMNEKVSEVGWKLPWILRKIQGVPQAKVSHHSNFKSQVWVGLSIHALLTAFGEQPRASMILTQMWQWISEYSSLGSFCKYFFFSLLEICKPHSHGLPLCSHCNFLSPQYK